jgi:uncharacterized protein YbjT (DUF2867 family)
LRFRPQDLSVSFSKDFHALNSKNPNFLVTGGAGFIGSNLTLALQEKYPEARLTVIDDFRSGDFKNLPGYRGDFVAADLAALDWPAQFGDEKFDGIFHLASITDTTVHDQFPQVHDNVESFRASSALPNPTAPASSTLPPQRPTARPAALTAKKTKRRRPTSMPSPK